MTRFVALLRAVNLGGDSTIRMGELRQWCEDAGLESVRTYIASGNLIFDATGGEAEVKALISGAIRKNTDKTVGVLVRSAGEMQAVLDSNPFPDEPGNRTVAIFLHDAPPKDTVENAKGARSEVIKPGKRELYVFYPDGQGRSKLKIPAAAEGTARNMNTVAKLVELSQG